MTVRSLGQSDDGKLDQTSETLAPFWLVQADDPFALPGFQGPPVTMLSTYQGWIQKIQMWLQRNHIPFMTYDMRQPRMPAPDLGGMFGFRFNQKEVVTKFLLADQSGLLGAPTRWGKTSAIVNTLRAYPGVKTVLTAPGTDLLLNNLLPDIRKAMPHLDIKVLCTGSKDRTQSEQLTICSVDSLYKCDPDTTRLVLIDEPHALPTDKRLGYFLNFKYARKLGFGATLEGRFDKRDPLIEGVIGPVLSKTTYKECRDIGAVAHLEVFMLKYSYDRFNCRDRLGAYKHLLFHNERITQILDIILNPGASFFPAQWQILGFIHNEKQANFLRENLKVPFDLAMAKLMTDKQRAEQMDRLKTGLARLTFATNIYAQGVTFSDLMVVLNLAGGGASTQTIQKPGRVLEVRPGKRCGIVIDFMFGARDRFVDVRRDRSDCWQPARESLSRKEYYQKVGFNVTEVGSLAELKELLRKRCWPISTCTT